LRPAGGRLARRPTQARAGPSGPPPRQHPYKSGVLQTDSG